MRVFITSMGIISPFGRGICDTIDAMRKAAREIKPLQLFPTTETPLPVGEISLFPFSEDLPRTHAIAFAASQEAIKDEGIIPDAVVIGVTTGGMPATEELLKGGVVDPEKYRNHSTSTIAEYIARRVGCKGPVLTVSTACSSGSVVLKIAVEMLRSGKVKKVLAGGVDALCRLTYHGFHALQLVDATGAHPFDKKRRGMSVGEGAAMLLLTAAEVPPENAAAELLGAGLSCDAHHPASPHPEGAGALRAMKEALSDACITPADIDYIHLHGTGTIDNDLAEARAVHALFADRLLPPLSSIKGSVGHSLAAAGAMGAAVSSLCITHGIIPANTGFREPDPELRLTPVVQPTEADLNTVLVNAFGFGGNNAALVIGRPRRSEGFKAPSRAAGPRTFAVLGSSCFTGAGDVGQTMQRISRADKAGGIVPSAEILRFVSEKYVRRMKRLCRLGLSLAVSACEDPTTAPLPKSVFFGTGWGGLSETHDFLTKLFVSGERFTSPTDFVGSVHNAAAGHIAIRFKATGPNVTMTGGDCSFEQALLSASLLASNSDAPLLVIGADEYHEKLSPLFDASVARAGIPADGGGALCLIPAASASSLLISLSFFSYAGNNGKSIAELVNTLGGVGKISDEFGAILVGIPAAQNEKGREQLGDFLSVTGYPHPVIDYRRFIGEFASASAVAAVLAVSFVKAGVVPKSTCHQSPMQLQGRGILVIGFGDYVTAMEIRP
ncbi:MAG TPA: beta-ketoacyl-[acyl-carrier-protein] synthase family protein [Syntrophales bacterium]|nr:beta-ketoacyl-[acyl-carrier-protein] synthase family protein [Syntrophales bacterium]